MISRLRLLLLLALAPACRSTPPAPDPATLDPIARRYVVLGLGLGRHDPNYVDAYYGPDSLRAAADAESLTVAQVRASAESLISVLGDSVPAYEDSVVGMRHRYLRVQLGAMATGRQVLRWRARQPENRRPAVVIGAGALGVKVTHALVEGRQQGIEFRAIWQAFGFGIPALDTGTNLSDGEPAFVVTESQASQCADAQPQRTFGGHPFGIEFLFGRHRRHAAHRRCQSQHPLVVERLATFRKRRLRHIE